MRLLMVGNLLPALRKSTNSIASLVSELLPFAVLALCASARYVSGLGLLRRCHLTMTMSATFTGGTC
jgi:hypothetical protein